MQVGPDGSNTTFSLFCAPLHENKREVQAEITEQLGVRMLPSTTSGLYDILQVQDHWLLFYGNLGSMFWLPLIGDLFVSPRLPPPH